MKLVCKCMKGIIDRHFRNLIFLSRFKNLHERYMFGIFLPCHLKMSSVMLSLSWFIAFEISTNPRFHTVHFSKSFFDILNYSKYLGAISRFYRIL